MQLQTKRPNKLCISLKSLTEVTDHTSEGDHRIQVGASGWCRKRATNE